MTDDEVIDAFVGYLRENGYPDLTVDRRPDKLDRSVSAIDAIAGQFAIEHTSLEALPDQRRNDAWVELTLHVWKRSGNRRGVHFKRQLPADRTPVKSVRKLLLRKARKLSGCGEEAETRVLLVENGDIALMNAHVLVAMVQAPFPDGRPAGVDELWFADTSIAEELEFRNLTSRIWPAGSMPHRASDGPGSDWGVDPGPF